jgi:Tol biopolymer transport system component
MKTSRLFYILIILSLYQIGESISQIPVVGRPRRVTPAGQTFLQPVWSPTGKWIALAGPNYNGIWLIKPDGSGLQQITTDLAVGYKMKWSPDGKLLLGRVAKYENRRRYNAIKAYEAMTKSEFVLSDFRTLMPGLPQWAGSSRRVALFANRGMEFFEIPNTHRQATQAMIDRPLVFAGPQGVIVGSTQRIAPQILAPVKGQVVNAELSPDGSKIAFEMAAGNLYVCRIDASGLVDLGRGERPQWSPDGSKIAFMISTDDGHRILSADIYVIRDDGSGKINLTQSADQLEMNCTWSPDGKHIAYDERNSGAVWLIEFSE